MLLEFSVGNYLSFKDKKTLNLMATSISEYPGNIITDGKYKALRSVAIYGANSSGKSNLLKGMIAMFDIIQNSAKRSSTDEIEVTPFLLNTETENKPSHFEIVLLLNGIRYRYGFEVCRKKVHYEWLFEKKTFTGKERNLFIREGNNIDLNDFPEGEKLESKTRENALFLAVCDQFNGTISQKIMMKFFSVRELSGIEHQDNRIWTIFACMLSSDANKSVRHFIDHLQLGFTRLSISNDDQQLMTSHNVYNKTGQIVREKSFESEVMESSGTNKILDLAGYLTGILDGGGIAIIDELDAKLHPLLTKEIVRMFNDPEINEHNAQLIFTTHDTNLLSYGHIRRDQIYFTEKNPTEETDLYSLVEYKEPNGTSVRKDRSYEKDYIAGRYGAIPFIGDFKQLIGNGKKA